MVLHESGEMYLESIYILSKRKNRIRSIDVVEYMGYSKPSVSRAMGLLRKGGYITVDEDGHLFLTDEGLKIAQTIYQRHVVLKEMLILLGVDEEIAGKDACRMEHIISDESFSAIKNHIEEKKTIIKKSESNV